MMGGTRTTQPMNQSNDDDDNDDDVLMREKNEIEKAANNCISSASLLSLFQIGYAGGRHRFRFAWGVFFLNPRQEKQSKHSNPKIKIIIKITIK